MRWSSSRVRRERVSARFREWGMVRWCVFRSVVHTVGSIGWKRNRRSVAWHHRRTERIGKFEFDNEYCHTMRFPTWSGS